MLTRSVILALVLSVIALLASVTVVFSPRSSHAAGFEADAQCVPVIQVCGCDLVPCKKGCCGGPNKYLCPCTDTTYGFTTTGICTSNFECTAQSYSGGQGQAGGGVDAGLKALSGLVGQLAKKLMGGGGGGGGGSEQLPPSAQGTALNEIPEVPETPTVFNTPPTPDEVPTIPVDAPDSRTTQFRAVENVFSTGGTSEGRTRIERVPDDATEAQDPLSSRTLPASRTTAQDSRTSGSQEDSRTTIESVTTVRDDTQISESDEGTTLTTQFVDEETNTGVAGFFGLSVQQKTPQEQRENVVGRLCSAQPWRTSFVVRLFSSSFFDGLCEKRGYVPGGHTSVERESSGSESTTSASGRVELVCPARIVRGGNAELRWSCAEAARSSGVNFTTNGWPTGTQRVAPTEDTTYTLECARGGSVSCTVEVVGPDVQIVAHPQRVPLGARTQIFWNSANVDVCTISGPNFEEQALSGSATTGSILNQSTFTIECEANGEVVVNDEVIIEVGI